MGRKKNRKRSASQRDSDEGNSELQGMAAAFARVTAESEENANNPPSKRQKSESHESEPDEKPKKNRKPTLTYAEIHKLNHFVKIADLQTLVLYCLVDSVAPQWLSLSHHGKVDKAVVVMVPGLEKAMFTGQISFEEPASKAEDAPKVLEPLGNGPDDYLPILLSDLTLPPSLLPLANIFEHLWPVKAPGDDKTAKLFSPLHAMLMSAIPKTFEERQRSKSKGVKPAQQMNTWVNERTPITQYLTSRDDFVDNDFVLHPALCFTEQEKIENSERRQHTKTTEADGWKNTSVASFDEGTVSEAKIEKGSITAGRTILAVDCEMCLVGDEEYALTRLSIVGWDGEVVLDEYIKPDKPIINYLTQFSGITPELLSNVTTTLSDIQERLLKLFDAHTILVGHSLESDLRAMKITHPFLVDTSIIFPHPKGAPFKSSLKWLSQKYLCREIQKGHGTKGHNSIEDARATLDLVKQKCERGPKWGESDANNESIFKRISRAPKKGSQVTATGIRPGKTGAIVDYGAPEKGFGGMATYCIGCQTDADVVDGVRRAVMGDSDGKVIPGGGVDLTWARLRELESLRGWRNENRTFQPQPQQQQQQQQQQQRTALSHQDLSKAAADTVEHIVAIRESLPPCTLFVVYSGTGDPLELARLQDMHRQFKKEYATKKWDELSVRWTDTEEQALRRAAGVARRGLGFLCVT